MKILCIPVAALFLALLYLGCNPTPRMFHGINGFDKARYLGKWYEIARFDFSFERGLNHTSAEYTLGNNRFIRVVNQGYNQNKKEWEKATGKARFVGSDTVAELEVSFFGPFYGGYNVIALDKDYQYALVAGISTKYLWILSRTKTIPENIRSEYLAMAKANGFEIDRLVWIDQSDSTAPQNP